MSSATESLPPVVFVVGDAAPLVEARAQEAVTAGLAACGIAAFNHTRGRGGESLDAAISAAQMPPMMADRRLVEIRDLHLAQPAELEALLDYLANPVPSTMLVLVAGTFVTGKGKPNWGVRFRNAVKKVGDYHSFKAADVDLARFAVDEARSLGKRLARNDAALLVEWLGADLARVRSEVHKLVLYVGDRDEVVAADIETCCALLGEAEIWSLTGAIAAGDTDGALAATHRLLSGGDDPRRLLAMIAWQLRDIVMVAEWARQGLSDRDIRQRSRVRFDVLKAVRQAGPRAPRAGETLSRLARANRQMNQHRAGANRILEQLVLELCS